MSVIFSLLDDIHDFFRAGHESLCAALDEGYPVFVLVNGEVGFGN